MSMRSKKKESFIGLAEINDQFIYRQLLAELIGTFSFVSISVISGINLSSGNLNAAFANGLMYASMIQVFGHISGAHLNPAVTMGALICGHIKVIKALSYILVQSTGAIIGSLIAYFLTDDSHRGTLSASLHHQSITAFQAFGLEVLMTFVLVSVFLSIGAYNLTGPLVTGLCLTGCQCSAVGLTASLNPAKSLGPAVVMGIWKDHWIYWAGPLLGGLLAGSLRRTFQWRRKLRSSITRLSRGSPPVTLSSAAAATVP